VVIAMAMADIAGAAVVQPFVFQEADRFDDRLTGLVFVQGCLLCAAGKAKRNSRNLADQPGDFYRAAADCAKNIE
jgi:hypothetical protein